MFHNKKWTRELCARCVDKFIRREQRYPTPQEQASEYGLPSNTTFRACMGLTILQYCRANYPELHPMNMRASVQAASKHLLWVERSVLESACGQWCASLAERPERADGQGFAEFVQQLQQQTQRQADSHTGGMSMS